MAATMVQAGPTGADERDQERRAALLAAVRRLRSTDPEGAPGARRSTLSPDADPGAAAEVTIDLTTVEAISDAAARVVRRVVSAGPADPPRVVEPGPRAHPPVAPVVALGRAYCYDCGHFAPHHLVDPTGRAMGGRRRRLDLLADHCTACGVVRPAAAVDLFEHFDWQPARHAGVPALWHTAVVALGAAAGAAGAVLVAA